MVDFTTLVKKLWSRLLTHTCVSRPWWVEKAMLDVSNHFNRSTLILMGDEHVSEACDFHIQGYSEIHYDDVIMTMLASQITSLTVVYSIVYSGVNQRKHHSSASQAFVRKIHRGPVNFPHKWPVTRKMFPFDDVIMICGYLNIKDHRKW